MPYAKPQVTIDLEQYQDMQDEIMRAKMTSETGPLTIVAELINYISQSPAFTGISVGMGLDNYLMGKGIQVSITDRVSGKPVQANQIKWRIRATEKSANTTTPYGAPKA